ncbi:MAG: hypothetical protein V3T42_11235 [Nitrospirales bacterium]
MPNQPYNKARPRTLMTLCLCILVTGPAIGGTPIKNDPNGFLGIQWGKPLADRADLKEIDFHDTLRIYTLKMEKPQIEDISMESVKLYTIEGKFVRILFRYQGKSIHESLVDYLESQFGKTDHAYGSLYGSMMRKLNQQYTWRGPDTEITITYHGYRERGFLIAESRVLAPLFLNSLSDDSF